MSKAVDLVFFVNLQQRLLKALRLLHPDYFSNKLLLGVPGRFELLLEDEVWEVFRHGVGFRFVRRMPNPNLVVDVHVDIEIADRIDAWRLQQFADSSGNPIELEEAKALLQQELDIGALVQRGDGSYVLKR